MVHNLSKELPFPSGSVDVVYHSHFLEHLDKPLARNFLIEVKRVMKNAAIHRIGVPDFQILCKQYIEHVLLCKKNQKRVGSMIYL